VSARGSAGILGCGQGRTDLNLLEEGQAKVSGQFKSLRLLKTGEFVESAKARGERKKVKADVRRITNCDE